MEKPMTNNTIQNWLDEYGKSHQNPTNKHIHCICVPLIFWTVTALIWAIPMPEALSSLPFFNWATVGMTIVFLFYIRLSPSITIFMVFFTALCFYSANLVEHFFPGKLVPIAISTFILLWVAQFIGHKIEGKKPSFFKDIQFLMIGPAWLASFIFQRFGIKY